MVSLKRYLNNTGGESTLRKVAALLFEKLGEYAVTGDSEEFEAFRTEMRAIHDALTPDLPPENLLILAGSATQGLETYNKRISRMIARQGADFQAIIKMIEDSLLKIGGENAEFVRSLGKIDEDLQRCSGFQDLNSLKQNLGVCLSGFRQEIEREKTASKARIEKLQSQIENFRKPGAGSTGTTASPARAPAPVRAPRPLRTTIGPRLREDCMAALQEAIDTGTRHFALVIVVNRVQPIIARFGSDAGKRMLARVEEHLQTQLLASDQVFRWAGPSMVSVLERPEALETVRSTVRRMLEASIEENYNIGGRSVLIPISVAWTLLMLASTPEAMASQIQTFIASQGCHDFA